MDKCHAVKTGQVHCETSSTSIKVQSPYVGEVFFEYRWCSSETTQVGLMPDDVTSLGVLQLATIPEPKINVTTQKPFAPIDKKYAAHGVAMTMNPAYNDPLFLLRDLVPKSGDDTLLSGTRLNQAAGPTNLTCCVLVGFR